MITAPVPVLGFAAYSGTGKTTLLLSLIPLLKAAGLRLGVIKQSHHDVEVDQPGKDSYRLRKAGAERLLLSSPYRWVQIAEFEQVQEPDLSQLLAEMDGAGLDLILVEGFRHVPFPKIELHRSSLGKPLLFPEDGHIIALAAESGFALPAGVIADKTEGTGKLPPLLDIDDVEQIRDFVLHYLGKL